MTANSKDAKGEPSRRRKRAKPVIVVAPLSITDDDHDAMPKTGLTGRRLREFVRAHDVRHHIEGRRMVVDAGDYVAKLRELASRSTSDAARQDENDDLSTPESVLAAAGLRLVGSAR